MAVAYADSEKLTPKVWKKSSLQVQRYERKNVARQKFYVVPMLRNMSLPRMSRLFISLPCPSTGRVLGVGMDLVAGNCNFADTIPSVVTCM